MEIDNQKQSQLDVLFGSWDIQKGVTNCNLSANVVGESICSCNRNEI